MKIEFVRSPLSSDSYFAQQRYQGHLHEVQWHGDYWGIQIGFLTSPENTRRSSFSAGISSDQFEELAQVMMNADPKAAIRAFGAAMQKAHVSRLEEARRDSASAAA